MATTPESVRPAVPRVAPLDDAEMTDDQKMLVGAATGITPAGTDPIARRAANIFRTLVRHPGLYRRWMPFGGKLLAGRLPGRDRELLILRTAVLCRSDYEWGQHVVIAGRCGITDDEIRRVIDGPDAPGWSPLDALLLRAADELHADSCLSDATWTALAAHYDDERHLIEIPMVIGHYHLVAYTLNTLGVPLDEGVQGFPS